MKVTLEQIAPERAEEVLLRCHDPKEPWVEEIQGIAAGQITVNGMADGKLCRLKLADIHYFKVVDGSAFFYCQKEVFSSKQKLYEFEALCVGTMLFRCSKSMILNAGKIDYVLPSLSGRFEAVLDNGEKVVISRQHYLCEISLEKMPYGSSWLYKSYTEESLTHITITAYYNVDEAFLQTPTAALGNLWDCRAALRKLVSSVYLESDLNLPFGKSGKFLFQLGYTPVVSDMNKIVKKAAASSFPTWTLAVWDMDTATLYMVKYDRSH